MTIFLLLPFFTILLGAISNRLILTQRRKFFFFTVSLMLILVSGLRGYMIGTDTPTYLRFFDRASHNYSLSSLISSVIYEKGFVIYVKLISSIWNNRTFFLLVTSLICVGSSILFIAKFSLDPVLSVVLYIFLQSYTFMMTGMRQAIAIALFMDAYVLYSGKPGWPRGIIAVALIVLATLFHTSAVFFFLLFAMSLGKLRIITVQNCFRYTVIISIAGFVLYGITMRLVEIIFPGYVVYFNGTWSDRNYNASLFQMLIQVVFMIVGLIYLRGTERDNTTDFAALVMFFSVVFYVLSMRMEIWERAAVNCGVFTGILWAPNFVARISNSKEKFAVRTAIIICTGLYMFIVMKYRPEWSSVVPYKFFWQ